MDLDGNGRRDVLSGSWPGEIYCFAEQEDGSWERRVLQHSDGSPIKPGSASTVFAADWDRDGDLDLVLGEIAGKVLVALDESGDDEPAAFATPVALTVDGKPLVVTGRDSGVCVADWDGDGHDDLLVGSGSGDVTYFRTTNDAGLPTLAAGQTLVPASGAGMSSAGGTSDAPGHGRRTKVSVADWNGDGHLDLLIGDFASVPKPAPELTDEQKKDQANLQARQQEIMGPYREAITRLQTEARETLGLEDGAAMTNEQRQAWSTKIRELMQSDEAVSKMMAEMREISGKLRAYMPGREYRGYVWVFTRKAPAGTPEHTGEAPADR